MKAFRSTLSVLMLLSIILVSCGEDAPATPEGAATENEQLQDIPCMGVVEVTTDATGKVIKAELLCDGGCASDQCRKRSQSDANGNRRSWCGCDDRESKECHIVLFEPAGGGEPRWFCPTSAGCRMSEERRMEGELTITRYMCRN